METLVAYLASSLAALVVVRHCIISTEERYGFAASMPRGAFALAFWVAVLPWALLYSLYARIVR
jgi:hypothetical protein